MVTADQIGNYVTAYATDLYDANLVGQELVVFGQYRRWDERSGVEIVSDPTGDYRVVPNHSRRLASPPDEELIYAGVVVAPGVLAEIVSWGTHVLDCSPEEFCELVLRDTAQWRPRVDVERRSVSDLARIVEGPNGPFLLTRNPDQLTPEIARAAWHAYYE